MEITGWLKSKHKDHIRIESFIKKQVFDVFYTESKKFDVEELIPDTQLTISVIAESVDFYSMKIARFWLDRVISPKPNFVYQKKAKEENAVGWADRHLKPFNPDE